MFFTCTSEFCIELHNLIKKPKDGYTNCKKDIKKEFGNLSFADLWLNPESVYQDSLFKMFKLRIPNSTTKVGKSGGYRLIFVIFSDNEEVSLLFIYPKSGKFNSEDVAENAYPDFLNKYLKEKSDNKLKTLTNTDNENIDEIQCVVYTN